MSWESVDWAVVVATFVGPIAAVGVTLWYQSWSADKQVRLQTFTEMMRNRSDSMSREFVHMVNVVPVHFRSSGRVLEAHGRLMEAYNDSNWEVIDAVPGLVELTRKRIAELLFEMSREVQVNITQDALKSGGYIPRGWVDEATEQRTLRQQATQLLLGEKALPIAVVHLPGQPDRPADEDA